MQSDSDTRSWLGSALVAASAVFYSIAGFFTRLIPLDAFTTLFWRGLFAGGFVLLFIIVKQKKATLQTIWAIGWSGLLVAFLSAFATVCYLSALKMTTVTEVMAINATSPFVSGALAWLIIGEKEDWKSIACSLIALVGVAIMVSQSTMSGNIAGALLALAMTLSLALMIVIMRLKRSISMLPASCLSAFLSAAIAWPFAGDAAPSGETMWLLILFGVVQFGLGLVLLTIGTRHISALRSSLISRVQTVLGPIWVWLAFGEIPPATTLVGGILVVGAAVAAVLLASTRPREKNA
ncbi:DMT family transporter [Terrarubrum flagellatum]|uniref:DMT family transporter n=1 Tax=Terrirubrum flagellatum TaxID=2895980 RepID=UPI0031455179